MKAYAFGTYPGMKIEPPNYEGTELDFGLDIGIVTELSCCDDTMILVTENGLSKAVGNNKTRKLGIGDIDFTNDFVDVVSSQSFKKCNCGDDFSIWITKDKQVYIAGGIAAFSTPTKVDSLSAIDSACYCKAVFMKVSENSGIFWPDFHDLSEKSSFEFSSAIQAFSCGNLFASVLCEDGSLFLVKHQQDLVQIVAGRCALNGGNRFISASSSSSYTAAIDLNGGLWIFGQMGPYNGDNAVIPIMEEARKVVALPNHCIVFDDLGLCFSFGANGSGQLGNGSAIDCLSPMPMNQRDSSFYASGSSKYTVLLPFGFDDSIAKYHDEDVIPGSLAKSLQDSANFLIE